MKGLWKCLAPFAPDQSGAVSVLYELGGILVIVDAGGCAGNVCGFDEPRWFTHKAAIYSAGLRDMDAIMGRDDRLAGKLALAAQRVDADFAALIGTPVPSVIGTDYHALQRLTEKKVPLPIMTVNTNGMEYYDRGAEKAYLALFSAFAEDVSGPEPGRVGVLGVTPMDFSSLNAADRIAAKIPGARCYGMGSGLDDIRRAGAAERNIVAAPSGLKAAEYLQRRFGTPFEIYDPLAEDLPVGNVMGQKVLVVAQQVTADGLRRSLLDRGAAAVTAATWFTRPAAVTRPGDIRLREEDDFTALVCDGGFDIICADEAMWPLIPDTVTARLVDLPHFALSGRLADHG